MGLTTTTTITCDCCGYSFSDGNAEERYTVISIPGTGDTTTKMFCFKKGCNTHVPAGVAALVADEAAAHVAANITTLVAAPTTPTVAVLPTGGTFAAATYHWKVSAVNAAGETLPSGEATLAVAADNRVTVSWTQVTGATGYRIYRSATSQTYGATSLVAQVGAVATYTDTGAATTAGALPTSNSTTGIPLVVAPLTITV